jgi:hypothetical protein
VIASRKNNTIDDLPLAAAGYVVRKQQIYISTVFDALYQWCSLRALEGAAPDRPAAGAKMRRRERKKAQWQKS